ncbi:hypothetical protein [Methylocapsa acidiphila]|uniref:hypothetical protein n=1 Tax=Methylocapsa acidiphila TaxID=133552 RepID=UPI00047D595D|nr:hypothetical protein [Methylocapsa acidiphila]
MEQGAPADRQDGSGVDQCEGIQRKVRRLAERVDGGTQAIRAARRQIGADLFRRREIREAATRESDVWAPSGLDQLVAPCEQLASRRLWVDAE